MAELAQRLTRLCATHVCPDCMQTRRGGKVPHGPRTPLNAIIGYSEMLREQAEGLGEETLLPDLQKVNAAIQPGLRPTTTL